MTRYRNTGADALRAQPLSRAAYAPSAQPLSRAAAGPSGTAQPLRSATKAKKAPTMQETLNKLLRESEGRARRRSK